MFRAYDATREHLVAVKLFRLNVPPERIHQLVREFERLIAAGLNHPAIAVPVATGINGESAYLVYDYVAAESLDLAVREYGPAPPADALRVAAQLAGAIDFAAAANIGHGAMHPRDVLLSADGTRLTGFGIAAAVQKIGIAQPVRRPYTAPERIDPGPWDRRADIFSLAALIHELLWGRRITGMGIHAVEGATPLASAHLSALQSVLARALAEDPEDRFLTALEFAEALKEAFPDASAGELRLPLEHAELVQHSHPSPPVELGESLESRQRGEPSLDLEIASRPPDEPIAPIANVAANSPSTRAPISVIERTRSAIWPLIAALMIGLALGFAAGYGAGSRERPGVLSGSPPGSAAVAATGAATTQPRAEAASGVTPATQGPTVTAAPTKATGTPASVNHSGDPDAPVPSADASRMPPAIAGSKRQPSLGSVATAPSASASRGGWRLLVRSTPAGARVILDGRDAGVTPAAIRDLQPGPHHVRIQRDGYITEERRLTLSAARPSQSILVPLTRGARSADPAGASATSGQFSGGLSIESRPNGASVYVDGRLVGTTPLRLDRIQAGEHAIRLERDGYRRWSSSVRVIAAESNRVTASLEK